MALKTTGLYTCGGNLFWIDPLVLSTPAVPLNHAGLKCLQDYTWNSAVARPEVFPGITHVVVHDTEGTFDKGLVRCLSPEEPRHAFILHLASRLTGPGAASDDEVRRLLCIARSCVMQFVYVPRTADMELTLLHKSINNREGIGADYESMYTTAIQRTFQAFEIQNRLSVGSTLARPPQVHEYYEKNIKISSGEAMSLTASGAQIPPMPRPRVQASP